MQDMAHDPTMASCCQRDAAEQAMALRLRATLTLVDPSRRRQGLRESVIVRDVAQARQAASDSGAASDDACSLATDSDEEGSAFRTLPEGVWW